VKLTSYLSLAACLLIGAQGALLAAPKLRLAATTVGPVSIPTGSNGTAQEVEIYNDGDGSLSVSASSVASWAATTVLGERRCSNRPGNCIPLRIALNTSGLAEGRHATTVTVTSAGANEGTQNLLVIVQMGGSVPDSLNLFVSPSGAGTTDSAEIVTQTRATTAATTQTGGNWLSVAVQGGSFNFNVPYQVKATYQSGMAEGSYTGAVQFDGSTLASDNKRVAVTLRVTSQPIARASSKELRFRTPLTTPKQVQRVVINNVSGGTLTLGTITAATVSGGNWLTAAQIPGYSIVDVTADPTGMQAGVYKGSVTVASNAANGNVVIPVEIEVFPAGVPVIPPDSVLNNATFDPGEAVAQGGIVAIKGEQLHFGDPQQNSSLPLPTRLGETQVFVNNQPVGLYYVSYNQINFLMPFEAAVGEATIRVERGGRASANTTIRVVAKKPKVLQLLDGGDQAFYAIAQNASRNNSFPIPARFGVPNSQPAREGDVLVIYALGAGATNPPVASGAAAPSGPLAQATGNWRVIFGTGVFTSGIEVVPSFVGLVPGFVGLYQINVQVPPNVTKGDLVSFYVQEDTVGSQQVFLAIQ